MAKRYQVFISSTYRDLKQERDQVIKQVLTMGHIPVGMEMFSADDAEQWEVIQREIDQSDYYLVIVKHRYGSVIKQEGGISFTEKEFDYAGEVGVPRIGFIVANGVAVLPEDMEDSPALKRKLAAFKKKVMGKPVSFWSTPEELGMQVLQALTKQIAKGNRPGWERASEDSLQALASFARLSDENALLREENARLKALASNKVPTLECQFLSPDGTVSHILIVKPEQLQTVREQAQLYLHRINNLVHQLNAIQKEHGRRLRSRSAYEPITMEQSYDFDPGRLGTVIRFLKLVGADYPDNSELWSFDDLYQRSIALTINYSGDHTPPEPHSGLDLEKYRTFKTLESLLRKINEQVLTHNYLQKHVEVRLHITNVSTAAAEMITVRTEFSDDVPIGLFELQGESRREATTGEKYERRIELLPAEDAVELPPFVVQIADEAQEIPFSVRITGLSFPKAQVIPLTIRVERAGEALSATAN